MSAPRKVVLLGMLSRIPVPGVVWQTAHYLLGLRRLGFDAYYVEAHGRTPTMLMRSASDDGTALAAQLIRDVMRRFGMDQRWAYQALHDDGRCYGMSYRSLLRLYDSAELIINLHGGTAPRPELSRTGRLVYLETDPGQLQVELAEERDDTIEFLEQHCAFFTFGENWGAEDCGVPVSGRFDFHPTRQPVCLDLWPEADETSPRFTTIGNWRQRWREVTVDGRVLTWSKDVEFERYLTLPDRTGRSFELALSAYDEHDRRRLAGHGWTVSAAADVCGDADRYRDFIRGSAGEFTVAKEQNVVLRTGWFSDRSASYLASARPVITQETGFSNGLPTGAGLHAFSDLDEAIAAVERVGADYPSERRAAREIAREYFDARVVLTGLLSVLGVRATGVPARPGTLATELDLVPRRRRPLRLSALSEAAIAAAPLPFAPALRVTTPRASVIVVSHESFLLTRLCVESVLANTGTDQYELIVVDNGSRDQSRAYLLTLARRFGHVQVVSNPVNAGFAAACNQGLAAASGRLLVLLNSDTIVAPGWLSGLAAHARDPQVGLVGAVTNRIGNEAEVPADYTTYGGFLAAAARRAVKRAGEQFQIEMPAMFCLAMRREVRHRLGPLDEGFGLGTLEDDDYAERARRAGYRLVCAEDVLVHHFGEGSFGKLYADGSHSRLLSVNRRRYEQKWGQAWRPYGRRESPEYGQMRERVRDLAGTLPDAGPVIVASRGDEDLLRLPARDGWHFPQSAGGVYAGHYPADGTEAIAELERLRARGGGYFLIPRTSLWWLEHYDGLRAHLDQRYPAVVRDDACVIFALQEGK